jgi:hypothetical protein
MKDEARNKVRTRVRLWNIPRRAASFVALVLVLIASSSVSTAQEFSTLKRDLASGSDFRLRVGAALALGRTHARAALDPLVAALDDPNPAVRVAAAAALGALGQRDAADALRMHIGRETSPAVRAQLENALAKLENSKSDVGARYLVKLGELKNLSGARGDRLAAQFRGATRARAAALPGVELVSEVSEGRREAASRKLPLLMLDGVLNNLSQGKDGERTIVSAQVEYVFRKIPEHALTGSVRGTAHALESAKLVDAGRVAELEMQALEAAVESAMKGAPDVMQQALR